MSTQRQLDLLTEICAGIISGCGSAWRGHWPQDLIKAERLLKKLVELQESDGFRFRLTTLGNPNSHSELRASCRRDLFAILRARLGKDVQIDRHADVFGEEGDRLGRLTPISDLGREKFQEWFQ